MSRERSRRLGVLFVVMAVAIPLAIVSTAWACGRLATLKLNTSSARVGTEVSGTGAQYNSAPTSSDVTVRLNSRRGRVLWSGRASSTGAIAPVFTVPQLRPGHYTILATQTLANGNPAAGTPGRATLRVRRSRSGSTAAVVSPWTAPPPARPGTPAGSAPAHAGSSLSVPTTALVGGGLAFVILSAAGGFLLLGHRRTRTA